MLLFLYQCKRIVALGIYLLLECFCRLGLKGLFFLMVILVGLLYYYQVFLLGFGIRCNCCLGVFVFVFVFGFFSFNYLQGFNRFLIELLKMKTARSLYYFLETIKLHTFHTTLRLHNSANHSYIHSSFQTISLHNLSQNCLLYVSSTKHQN